MPCMVAVSPRDALAEARQALLDGPAEPSSVEGAKVNALHSIAWSLMGLLAEKIEDPQASEGLNESLQKLGLMARE